MKSNLKQNGIVKYPRIKNEIGFDRDVWGLPDTNN